MSMDGMDGMDMDGGSSSNMSSHGGMSTMMMAMIFQTNKATPLYSSAWTPHDANTYAGTCIFLVILSIVARLLLAFKTVQEARWLDRDAQRRYIVVNGKVPIAERIAHDPDAKQMVLSENGAEETVYVVERKSTLCRPWRFSVDPLRAVMDTVLVGIGYLLMLAVMTMNVGYFLSILAGVFAGSLAVGRYSAVTEH